jgi:DNA-binding NtrC family response regulator
VPSAKTTEGARRGESAEPRDQATLVPLYSPEGGIKRAAAVVLRPGRFLVGRELEAGQGLTLDDPRASRTHASLHVTSRSQRVRICDEQSRNGTRVNGDRVEEAWLEDGDVVRLADSYFLFRVEPADLEESQVDGLLGRAPAVRQLRATVRRVAGHEITVLVTGESGSGKEVVARAIHTLSGRRGSFIAVNCAAIPETLAESQLFGHVAGSFTGARGDHDGFFRAADGGTIFLDEVGELPQAQQPKLLRALENRCAVPVGATDPVHFDVRIIAATNRDLAGAVNTQTFRGDLYARLSEFNVALPSLRDRREDVLILLEHAYGSGMPPLEPDLVEALLRHRWPFNVRELRAVASELKVRGAGKKTLGLELVEHRLGSVAGTLGGDDEPADGGSGSRTRPSLGGSNKAPPTREEFERILAQCKGNVRAIARETGRSRMQVYRWVEQYGLDLARYRDE